MYWEKEVETLGRRDLENFQCEKLTETIRQAAHSSYYGKTIRPNDIKNIDQVKDLPFTTKEDLRSNFPWGFLSADKKEVVRLHSSSGTTGNPTVVYHNRHDLSSWANLMARSL